MTISIRAAGYQPEQSVHTQGMRALTAAVERLTGGAAATTFTANIASIGRPAADLLSMTEQGWLELSYFSSSYMVGRVPELGVLDLPFEATDRARVWAKLDGEMGRRLGAAVAARTGYTVLGYWDNGIRHVSNRLRAIKHPRDCEGMSLRTLDNSFHQAMFGALGFKPRFIDVKDLGPAVASGEIDAQENPLTNTVNFGLHTTHRHVSLTGHFFGIVLVLANRAALERWPAGIRDAAHAAAAEAGVLQRRLAAAEDQRCLEALAADGVEVAGRETIDIAAFKAAVAGVVANETAGLDAALLEMWRS